MSRGNVNVRVRSSFDDKGTKQAEGALARLNTASKHHMGAMTKHALGYGAALIGGAGVVGGLEAVAHASIDAEKSQAKLDAQLHAVGISYKAHSKQINDVIAKTSAYSGFLDKDLTTALASIVRSTGNLHDSYRLLGLATDVARAKNIDVASAGALVAKVQAGQTRVLKSLGIAMDPVTKAQDRLKETTKHATDEQKRAAAAEDKRATAQKALAALQQKLGGQAKAYGDTTAGSLDKMKAAVDHLEVKLGNALAPTLKNVADHVAKFVSQMQSGTGAGGRFADKMKDVWDKLKKVFGVVKDVATWLGKHPQLLAAAGAAWVAYKTAALAQIAIVKLASLGLFGPSMRAKLAGEAGETGKLAGRGFAARAGAVAAAGVAGWEVGTWLRNHVPAVRAAGNFLGTEFAHALGINARTNFQKEVDQMITDAQRQAATSIGHSVAAVGNIGKGALQKAGPRTGRGKGGPQGTGHVSAHGSSVVARASAVGASVLGPVAGAASATVTGDISGLRILPNLRAMAQGTGQSIHVTSGFRTAAEQQALVNEKGVWSKSNPTGAAPVGTSAHEKGLAADISPGREVFGAVAARYGLSFPIAAEPWHCQAAGAATVGTRSTGKKKPIPIQGGINSTVRIPGLGIVRAGTPVYNVPGLPPSILANIPKSAGGTMVPGVKIPVSRTTNDWLNQALDYWDKLAAAGRITPEEANRRKIASITAALPNLRGADQLTAQGALQSLQPGHTAVADEQARLDTIGLHVRAGDITEAQGRAQEIASLKDALANWNLTDDERLQLRAELGDLQKSVDSLDQTMQQHNELLQTQNDNLQRVIAIGQSEEHVLGSTLANLVASILGGRVGAGIQTPTRSVRY